MTANLSAEPRVSGWCAWHGDVADGVRVIQIDEQGSGSGGVRYACAPCRKRHGLTPLIEQEPRGTGPAPTDADACPGRLVLMPGMFPLMTAGQREGRNCPWCNELVDAETGVDLGERRMDRVQAVIHPVACRPCANHQARASFAQHCRMCFRCKQGEHCPDKLPLYRLAVETRS
ncbi:hypothetical protein ACFVFT_15125 [Streptomyces tendae]|uniref:hypothetical protein n=1 Tax=Streptomyces tendae TaxID=1932 RepID=UPI003677DFA6